jgi:ribonuclease P protein component
MRYLQAEDVRESRVGYVIRKRAGKAVMRNAMRRILREAFRASRERFSRPVWAVFEVSDRAAESTRAELRLSADFLMQSLCREAG